MSKARVLHVNSAFDMRDWLHEKCKNKQILSAIFL